VTTVSESSPPREIAWIQEIINPYQAFAHPDGAEKRCTRSGLVMKMITNFSGSGLNPKIFIDNPPGHRLKERLCEKKYEPWRSRVKFRETEKVCCVNLPGEG
jgi:hypothetical protein